MRIAVYHNLPSGGGKRALFEMVQRLSEEHQLYVYSLSTAAHDFADLRPFAARYVIYPFKPYPFARRPFGRLNAGIRTLNLIRLHYLQRFIARKLDREGHDVLFVHNCQFSQSPDLLQFTLKPTLYYCQEPPRSLYEPVADRPYTALSRAQRLSLRLDPLALLYRRVLRVNDSKNVLAATEVLVNSDYSRETMYHIYGILTRVGRLGVDVDKFRPLDLAKRRQVISVGAIGAHKGFDFIIRALSYIPSRNRPPLLIVSNAVDQREADFLAQLAKETGVKLTTLRGVSDEKLVQLYNQSMVTVYTPLMEPFGFVPLESMACATPVVGVREAGVRETVIDKKTGVLVDRVEQEFAQAVERLLSDDDLRASLGSGGRKHVRVNWTWDSAVEELESYLYGTVAKQTREFGAR